MFTLNCKGRLLEINEPVVMGIINTTPDSFYSESRQQNIDDVLRKAERMIGEGAAILDIGGQSTRPGAQKVNENEELKRVLPAVEAISRNFPQQIISIDTYYAKVALSAAEAGASIINDVSAGSFDPAMIGTVAALQLPYVLMHIKGDPSNMQDHPHYENVTPEVFDRLNFQLMNLEKLGIKDVIIDPGFGFGKTIEHNFRLLAELNFFSKLDRPLLVGLSRKATVYKTLGITANQALNGTTAIHTIALLNGASILRVHDVKEAVEAIKITEAYRQQKSSPEAAF